MEATCPQCSEEYNGTYNTHRDLICQQRLVAVGPSANLLPIYLKRISGFYRCPFMRCPFLEADSRLTQQHVTAHMEEQRTRPEATEITRSKYILVARNGHSTLIHAHY